jgi:hypothetical protein
MFILLVNAFFPINYDRLVGLNVSALITILGVVIIVLYNNLPRNSMIYYIISIFVLFYVFREVKRYFYYEEMINLFPVLRIVVTMLAFTMARSMNDLRWTMKLTIVLIFLSMMWGFGIYFYGDPFAAFTKAYGYANENWVGRMTMGSRMVGFFGDIVLFSYQLTLLPVFFWIKFRERYNILYLVLILIVSFAMIINGERALILAVIAGIMMYEGIGVTRIFKNLLAVMLIVVTMWGANHFITSRTNFEDSAVERLTEEDEHLNDRFLKQYAALLTIINNPWTGGSFQEYDLNYGMLTGHNANAAHNYYLNIARDIGIIAWFMFAFLIYLLLKHYRILKKHLNGTDNFEFIHQIYIYIIAVSIIGLAHNAGLFYSEVTLFVLTGILISSMSISFSLPEHQVNEL